MIIGLFIGGLLPYSFSAFSMNAVGRAAGGVVTEVRRQLKATSRHSHRARTLPEYGTCVDIVTKAALKEMIVPALLPVADCSSRRRPARWHENSRRCARWQHRHRSLYGHLDDLQRRGVGQREKVCRGRQSRRQRIEAHKASVTGDTVGDPYKDTSGPAINPMIKVVNIVAILIIPIFF